MKLVTTPQMKQIEKQSDEKGVTYSLLMENAGTALGKNINALMSMKLCEKAIFLCGKGNNGGDCYVAARYLKNLGIDVSIAIIFSIPESGIAKDAYMKMSGIKVYESRDEIKMAVMKADTIIDGVFGTGFHGDLDENIAVLLNMNKKALRIAVDIPSGGDATTGSVSEGTFKADYTVTFGYKKVGMTQYPLMSYCGKIITADIGIPEECSTDDFSIYETEDSIIPKFLRDRIPDSHKGTYGTLTCITGSAMMPGASILSGMAALRCGCGLVKVTAVRENIPALAVKIPEAVFVKMKADEEGFYLSENLNTILQTCEKSGAVLIGCGLGKTEETQKLVKQLLKTLKCTVVLDADGINCICDDKEILNETKARVILTPHPAEMSRLTGSSVSEIQHDRLGTCLEFLKKYPETVVVLKGAGTIIASKNEIYVNNTGNPGMSCGGSGDVLSGMTASFASQGTEPFKAAVLAAYMHGKAGDIAAEKLSMYYMQPSDIVAELPELFLKK